MAKRTKDLVDEIENVTHELGGELCNHPEPTPRFRRLTRALKKLVIELAVKFDG
jgi:hypothetical protein